MSADVLKKVGSEPRSPVYMWHLPGWPRQSGQQIGFMVPLACSLTSGDSGQLTDFLLGVLKSWYETGAFSLRTHKVTTALNRIKMGWLSPQLKPASVRPGCCHFLKRFGKCYRWPVE